MTGQFDPAVHSFNGLLEVSIRGSQTAIDDMVIQTTEELKDEFPFNLDMNSGDMLGIGEPSVCLFTQVNTNHPKGWTQSTIGDSKRSSSATSFLAPQFIARNNMDVILGTQATKLLMTGSSKGLPEFRGVEFAQSPSGAYP